MPLCNLTQNYVGKKRPKQLNDYDVKRMSS